jgi:predicted aconitase
MPLHLTEKDQQMLHGDHGPATRMAMRILVCMAEVSHAQRLLDICGAHIDSSIYIGEAGLEFAERLASLGAAAAVFSGLRICLMLKLITG